MRVLVAGGAGFVGRHLTPLLVGQGHDVVVLDNVTAPRASRAVVGDILDPAVRAHALDGCDAVIHLATVPGGAAEDDPAAARRINVEATMALSEEFAARRNGGPFIFASSVAVYGHPLPRVVDASTRAKPHLLYGAHKAMAETWLDTLHRRGSLRALSLRLPGIIARPQAPSGMKSAYLSNIFHALRRKEEFEMPVSPEATSWLMSVAAASRCFARALRIVSEVWTPGQAITLQAQRVRVADLVKEIARQTCADPALVRYERDEALEAAFGRNPPLRTVLAERYGLFGDSSLAELVASALSTLDP